MKWIDARKELPPKNKRVLLYTKFSCDDPHIEIGYFTGRKTEWRMWQFETDEATGQSRGLVPDFWMNLPDEPIQGIRWEAEIMTKHGWKRV